MARRANSYRETVYGKCGHLCGAWPRFLNMVVCDYCTRDAIASDPTHDEVWVAVRERESAVKRKLSTPRARKIPEQTIPLFDIDTVGSEDDKPPF